MIEFSEKEISKMKSVIKSKFEDKHFTFNDVTIELRDKQVIVKFSNIKHKEFSSIVIFSHNSYIQDTPFYTRVHFFFRFLYNNRKSPVIGHNLVSFRIVLDDESTPEEKTNKIFNSNTL